MSCCVTHICRIHRRALLARELASPGIVHSAASSDSTGLRPPRQWPQPSATEWTFSSHRRVLQLPTGPAADLIVVMDAAQQRLVCERFGRWHRDVMVLGDLDPAQWKRGQSATSRSEPGGLDQTYERIARCVRELAKVLRKSAAYPAYSWRNRR